MKKASLFLSAAAAALLAGSMSAPVLAQGTGGPFADVPVDHWAYKAVDTLQKDGIVIGYPDGTYGGKRAMTRYEFAVAIARLLEKIPPPTDLSNYVTKSDLSTALTPYALKSDLAGFAKQTDLDALTALVNEFKTELTTLGVDLDATKKRLDALEGRVTRLEAEVARVKVGGATSIYARGNNRLGSSGRPVIDADGFSVSAYPGRGSVLHDSEVLHDIDLTVTAHVTDTITAITDIDYGNYLPYLGSIGSYINQDSANAIGRSNQSGGFSDTSFNQSEALSVYKAEIDVPVKFGKSGVANFAVGRIPIQFTDYTLKLINVNSYFDNAKTNSGDIPVDGGKVQLNLGPIAVTAVGAKTDPINYLSDENSGFGLYAGASHGAYGTGSHGLANYLFEDSTPRSVVVNPGTTTAFAQGRPTGSSINPYINGAMLVEEIGGVRANVGLSKYGTLGATYLVAGGTSTNIPFTSDVASIYPAYSPAIVGSNADFDRVFVYGGDLDVKVSGIGLKGSYTKSDTAGDKLNGDGSLNSGSHSKLTSDNAAWDAAASIGLGSLNIVGGYKEVDAYFAAPGSWDKLGSYTNPTDIKGPYVKGTFGLAQGVDVIASAKFYEGTGKDVANGGLETSDKITNYKAGLKFGYGKGSGVDLGIEATQYKIGETGLKPIEYFYNIGYGYTFSPAALFKVSYQIADYQDKNSGFDPIDGKGGILATEFAVKF